MLRRKDKSPLKADGRAQSEDGDGEAKTKRRDGETRNRGSVEWVLRGNYFGRRSEEVEGASRSKSVCAELPCFRFSCQALSVTTSSVQASGFGTRQLPAVGPLTAIMTSSSVLPRAEAEWEYPKQSQASAPYSVCEVDHHHAIKTFGTKTKPVSPRASPPFSRKKCAS